MDVYRAVFGAKPEDLKEARRLFIRRFGADSFETQILPYISRGTPGFLFSAPDRVSLYWFINCLADLMALRFGEEYVLPEQFLAVVTDDREPETCPICETVVANGSLYSGGRYGVPNKVCLKCHSELSRDHVTSQQP